MGVFLAVKNQFRFILLMEEKTTQQPYVFQDGEDFIAQILKPNMEERTRGSKVIEGTLSSDSKVIENGLEGEKDQSKLLLEQLERNYIFQKENIVKPKLLPLVPPPLRKKQVKLLKRLRISQRSNPIQPMQKKRQLDQLEFQRDLKVARQKKFVTAPVQPTDTIICSIIKDKQGLFDIGSKYLLSTVGADSKFLLAAQKKIGTTTTYIISTNPKSILQTDNKYRGKVSSNFLRKEWIVYDEGFNPSRTRELSECRKQLAYIGYEKKLWSDNPRKMQVLIPGLDENLCPLTFRPLEDFNQLMEGHLAKLNTVLCYTTKQPVLNTNSSVFSLDFGKRQYEESDKNFILVDAEKNEYVIFCKKSENQFTMEVKHPFSIYQAFAICLSNIDPKLLVD